jgi:predicted transcriptional regulator
MLAQNLMTEHHMNQVQTAKLLDIRQPAVSLYSRKMRGKAIDLQGDIDVSRIIAGMTESLAKQELPRKEFVTKLCELCRTIRAKGLMCKLHESFDESVDTDDCGLCATPRIKCN